MKRYISYKSSGVEWIGDIPFEWEIEKLKYLCNTTTTQISQDKLNGIEVIHYSIPNVQSYRTGVIENGSDIDSSKLVVYGGELLFSKLNPRKNTTCIVSENKNYLNVCSGEFISLVPYSNEIEFLHYVVSSESFIDFIDSQVESVTRSHQRVRPETFLSSFIPIPPLNEQQQIVQYLDEKTEIIDKLISTKERKINLLKEQRTSLINEVITKGLDPNVKVKDSGVEWIGKIPDHWIITPIKHLGSDNKDSIVDGPFGSSVNVETDYGDEFEIPVVRTTNITDLGFRTEDLKFMRLQKYIELKRHNVISGDILLSKVGTIGNVCLFPPIFKEGILSTTGSCRIRTNENRVSNYFLIYSLLNSKDHLKFLSESNVQPFLNMTTIKNVKIPIPPLTEQQIIVEYLDTRTKEIDDLVSLEQKKIDLLKEYRQSLISEVVTGKIDVRTNPN